MRFRRPVFVRRLQSLASQTLYTSRARTWTSQYSTLLAKYPLLTKTLTSAALAGVGDIVCQLAIEDADAIDFRRLSVFTAVGGAYIAPLLHVSYGMLNRMFVGVTTTAVLQRVAVDQLVLTPAFFVSYFALMQTLSPTNVTIEDKLRQEWWPTVQANWIVWVPAQLLNFRFIRPSYQVLFSNVVSLFWNAYMSFVSHNEGATASRPHDSAARPP
ncbi:hypothetical protein H310_06814 [Aphanomyces invadans]|uniref:Protein Mpv17 n=1 Tax=Aphanomyces invadans TaxID=157072 RepID=A0A024U6I6_9STRA|nr:hypothetical protein H310_06814 [Aphanomyces invadans]ETW01228.1 hypothetical protein H310_06814 [Aphanomyces invadans]|eukprot:XP_008870226.1 hypothetical protein H310_06814 [Aphanomyces invadans]